MFRSRRPGGVDARVDVTFREDGDYYVAVHDSKFSSQAQNFYRLKIGSFAYADGIFPLGWKRGADVEVELFGGNGAIVFAVACVVAYSCSGHKGIYHAQPIAAHKSGRRDGV